jgi:hypothetical protein
VKGKSIPEPSDDLQAQCNAENQFSNFENVFRKVMSVPKAEVLKREAKDKHRNARKRARGKKVTDRCNFPECRRIANHRHHVLGDEDDSWIEPLCKPHHAEITRINTEQSGPGYKLFARKRRRIYLAWKRGELKAQGNPYDDPRIAEWD